MKQKTRYRRKRKGDGLIGPWPADRPAPHELAKSVQYVGSSDHKSRPVHESYDVDAVLRSDGKRRTTSDRFLLARALHHWLYVTTPDAPQRLLTRSGDWQQAASRAFAAELLAPARALEARLADRADWHCQEALAGEFDVSPMVIAHQIENHALG